MNNPGLFQARWNVRRLALCNFVPLALLAFWLWPTGQMQCVIFDEWFFHLLNSPLAINPIWLHIRVIASLRPFDAAVRVILLVIQGLTVLFMMPRLVAGAIGARTITSAACCWRCSPWAGVTTRRLRIVFQGFCWR